MLDEHDILNDDGKMNPEWKTQAEELIVKLATLCKDYPQTVVMFVLEAALTEQIAIYSPVLDRLFTETMAQFRKRAILLLTVADALREGLDRNIGETTPEE